MLSKSSLFIVLLFAFGCSDTATKTANDLGSTIDMSSDAGLKNDPDAKSINQDQGSQSDATITDTTITDMAIADSMSITDTGNDVTTRPDFGDTVFGGDRPAQVFLPDDYDVNKSYPLVTLLHGYRATGNIQNSYMQIGAHATELQFILILPDGLKDGSGNQYWNATDSCCDFYNTKPDDSGYLIGLVDEAIMRYNIDEKRVYFMGHSNGGFMSYTMACEYGDRIAAISSFAGTTHLEPTECPDTGDVSVLHIHGNLDATININGSGGNGVLGGYPGASETVNRWVTRNGCPENSVDGEKLDIVNALIGDETETKSWSGCDNNTEVASWKINGGSHTPIFNGGFADKVLEFLLSKSK